MSQSASKWAGQFSVRQKKVKSIGTLTEAPMRFFLSGQNQACEKKLIQVHFSGTIFFWKFKVFTSLGSPLAICKVIMMRNDAPNFSSSNYKRNFFFHSWLFHFFRYSFFATVPSPLVLLFPYFEHHFLCQWTRISFI